MAERVRKSHVVATDDTVLPMLSPGQTQPARMWVYVGDESNPYNVFDFTLNRSREGPKEFLKDYTQVLLADAYGGYNGVVAGNAITRAGCWSQARRKFVDAEKAAPEIAREAVARIDTLFALERQAKDVSVAERLQLRQEKSVPLLAELHRKLLIWKEQLLPRDLFNCISIHPKNQLDELLPDKWMLARRCAPIGNISAKATHVK